MGMQRIYSGAPWEKKAGYCRAIRAGDAIAVSGTAPMADGQVFAPGDMYAQTRRCLEIIEQALSGLGSSRKGVLRTRIFVTDISRAADVMRAHGEFFAEHHPAATLVEVRALVEPEMLVEIEADAVAVRAPGPKAQG